MNIKILDCTLRDGGYINSWAFSNKQINSILTALENAEVDIIECGYLNDKKGKVENSTLFDNLTTIDKLLENIESQAQKVVMINLGDYDINQLKPKSETAIDGIRLAFHKKDLEEALVAAKQIIDLGYKLYFQPMVTKNYKDVEFLSMIEKVNQLNLYSFYIVDSFGSMTLDEFNKYLVLSNNHLNRNIFLGYHSHNNMQLAFSNAVSMCTSHIKRDIIVDASIYGIGRGAGNLNTELIADYLNQSFKKEYDTLPLLEIIDAFLNSLMKKTPWGFSPAQFLSASFNCHPNYATYIINKNTNHIVGVRKVLEQLPDDKKSSFDKNYIKKLYIESLLEVKSLVKGKLDIPTGKKVLLIASGRSLNDYLELIKEKTNDNKYVTIALNHNPKFDCDYYFFSNQKRFDEFASGLSSRNIVITSNIFSKIELDLVLNFENLAFTGNEFVSNVAMVMIHYLIARGHSGVMIAGLDGYVVDSNNYNYTETSVIVDRSELTEQNNLIQKSLNILSKDIKIDFLTPSIFEKGLM